MGINDAFHTNSREYQLYSIQIFLYIVVLQQSENIIQKIIFNGLKTDRSRQ